MRKLKITFSDKGVAYSDFNVKDIVIKRIVPSYNDTWDSLEDLEGECYDYEVSTENFLLCIRFAVLEKKLDNDKVVIIYRDKEYHLDVNGNYIEPVIFGAFQLIPIKDIRI